MRRFKFDFIKDNIEVVCEFEANISSILEGEQLAEELLRELKHTGRNFTPEYLHYVFDGFYIEHANIIFNYKKSLNVFLECNEDWQLPKSRYDYLEYHFFGIADVDKAIGNYDFYYSIASFGHFMSDGYEGTTVLIRRIKDGKVFNYKDIQQTYSSDFIDGDFGTIKIQDLSYTRTINSLTATKSNKLIFEEQGLGKHYEYLPVNIPGVYNLEDFSACINALIDINNINTKEDIIKIKQSWND